LSGEAISMGPLIELFGLLFPDTMSAFRIRLCLGGLCGVAAGLLILAGPVEGMALYGLGCGACGMALIGLSAWDAVRSRRQREAALNEERSRIAADALRKRGQELREAACEEHDWQLDEQGLNYDARSWVCRRCAARTDENPHADRR
jgi:hypothetical protein